VDRIAQSRTVTRQDAFRWGAKVMTQAGVPDPARDATVLMGHVTGEDPCTVLINRIVSFGAEEALRFEGLVGRRCCREPLSHLLGFREFRSLEFKVTRDVLTPRPETETLLDLAEELGAEKVHEICAAYAAANPGFELPKSVTRSINGGNRITSRFRDFPKTNWSVLSNTATIRKREARTSRPDPNPAWLGKNPATSRAELMTDETAPPLPGTSWNVRNSRVAPSRPSGGL